MPAVVATILCSVIAFLPHTIAQDTTTAQKYITVATKHIPPDQLLQKVAQQCGLRLEDDPN